MSSSLTFSSAFLIGFFTTLHCVGMCGSIIGALSLGLPENIRNHKLRLLIYISSYNLGRIISYSLAGLIAGILGTEIVTSTGLKLGHQILQYTGVSMMIAVGLYLSGWLPKLANVEKVGLPFWKKIEPFSRHFLPISTPYKALAYGMIWGWLPCGMVYFVLIWALTAGSGIQGAGIMFAFGLGTLPTLLVAGFITSWLTHFSSNPKIRALAGLLIIGMAIGSLYIPMDHRNGDDKQTNQHEHIHHH